MKNFVFLFVLPLTCTNFVVKLINVKDFFMKKVLLINGSPHKEGNTYLALSEVARTLNRQGIEAEIAWIGVKPVRGCIACGNCKQSGSGKCVFNDDVCNERNKLTRNKLTRQYTCLVPRQLVSLSAIHQITSRGG